MLEEAVQTAFQWADENAVKFDDNKSELIHFQRQRRPALETITLPNETVISPAETVRWLGVWLDRKLNFKTHVQKKTAAATRTLHLINRLLNSERGLSANASRQLYLTCITSISDYRAKVWYKGQKGYLAQLQKI